MSRSLVPVLALMLLAMPATGSADDRCRVPLADWQPREALAEKLERAGWRVVKIRIDDGCYKVLAVDRDGRSVKGRFDPATLGEVARGGHDHHGRHGDPEDERD